MQEDELQVGQPLETGILGVVLSVRGSQASIGLKSARSDEIPATVGRLLSIESADASLIAVITEVSLETMPAARDLGCNASANLDLIGEIKTDKDGRRRFERGVSAYPAIGDPASGISPTDLHAIYDPQAANVIDIGHLQQDLNIAAFINVDEMLCKHFAVLGTTGVGKSSGLALILQRTLKARPDLRVFLIDAHNEYGRCFSDQALVLSPRNLRLPFWLLDFDEFCEFLFGPRSSIEEEIEILTEVIPLAKAGYNQNHRVTDRSLLKRGGISAGSLTVDTPVPYRLSDLVALIDERMGKLENRSSRMKYYKLINRIEAAQNDPRYAFMFENANVGGDTMKEILGQIFRLPADGKPITIMQLAGLPAEMVDAVVSVLSRMAFELGLWSDGASPLLFVCEEAHRFAPADRNAGFAPTRKAIARIAKEGRKYGVFLGLVSQRPAELDATVLSQCSTIFAMRLANDRDQDILKSAVSDAAANLTAFVPSLGTAEVLAFGEGVAVPTRLKFSRLPPALLPKSETLFDGGDIGEGADAIIAAAIERWRGASMRHQQLSSDQQPSATRWRRDEFSQVDPDLIRNAEPRPAPAAQATSAYRTPASSTPERRTMPEALPGSRSLFR